MNVFHRAFSIAVLASFLLPVLVSADSLELADGTMLEGDFVGSSNGAVMFNTGDSIEAYPENQVVGIFLSEGVATAQAVASAPPPVRAAAPAGTRLVIRMVDSIDSKKHKAGHKFRGQLEGALVVDGSSGAKTGAKVGVGASLLTGGESINVPAGTLLETALRTPLTL